MVSEKSLLHHRSWSRHGWDLPNTRRWRKIVRKALGQPKIRYDLIVDPGAAGVGCVFDGPPSYMYTQYGVVLDVRPIDSTGRFGESKPNWQDLPPRLGRLIGTAAKAEQDREYAIRVMQGLWEESLVKIREDTERILHANAANDSEPPRD